MDEETEKTTVEKLAKRRRMPKSLRRALLSAFILLVVIVGGGVAYVWYSGTQTNVPVKTVAPVQTETQVIKPSVPAANAPESAAVETLTSPVNPGSNVTINVKTLPKSQCTISVIYGSTPSKDSGLVSKQADAYGTISWTWTVEPTVPVGSWPVHVTCAFNSKTAVVDGTLIVTKAPVSG